MTTDRKLNGHQNTPEKKINYRAAETSIVNGGPMVTTSSGKTIPMTDPSVMTIVASVGRIAGEALGACFKSKGHNTFVHPPSDETILRPGRANTRCKECLPLLLTTGSLLNYLQKEKNDGVFLVKTK